MIASCILHSSAFRLPEGFGLYILDELQSTGYGQVLDSHPTVYQKLHI